MRSFFKNSFGFKQIPPSVFIGVLIVLVIVFINPFKSGLSAISNVSGWSDRGTPKNKDTWNGARYYSADDCAKYAISQGNVGYTWRNNNHPESKGRSTCVTIKNVEPQNLNNPMRDTDYHTSGCSVQNKKWPNCGWGNLDYKTTGLTINNFINNEINPLIARANDMLNNRNTTYLSHVFTGSLGSLKKKAQSDLSAMKYYPCSGSYYQSCLERPFSYDRRDDISLWYGLIDTYKRFWTAAVGNEFNESQILEKIRNGDNSYTQQVNDEIIKPSNQVRKRDLILPTTGGSYGDLDFYNMSDWVKLSYTDVYNLYLAVYKYNWLTITATNELEQVYQDLNNAITETNNRIKDAPIQSFSSIKQFLQDKIDAVGKKKSELVNTWNNVIYNFKYLKYPW